MTAADVLRSNEESAIENNQIVYSGVGGKNRRNPFKLKKGMGAGLFITAILVVFLIFFSVGNLIPDAISERLTEETDVNYANATQTKIYVFQKALKDGSVPANTIARLANAGVTVGHGSGGYAESSFSESSSGANLSLKIGDKVVTADEFPDAVMHDARLYDAFQSATYGRAAYYYDSHAQIAFQKIGASRNNYTDDSKSFEEVMDEIMGSGNNINVGVYREVRYTVTAGDIDGHEDMSEDELAAAIEEEKNRIRSDCENNKGGYKDDGDAIICYESDSVSGADANTLVASVGSNYNNQDTSGILSIADTISNEQRSSKFFLGIMENISKMKAGYGNESKINEAMNYLFEDVETEVTDVKTGEKTTINGSAMEAPGLYAALSGERLDTESVQNYSTERIMAVMNGGKSSDGGAISDSFTSTNSNVRGTIGRIIGSGRADNDAMEAAAKIVDSSLVSNSFDTIRGINAGQLLLAGAVNTNAENALQSGSSVGSASAVQAYNKVTEEVLAMEAEVDRMHRSPLDITSKNTFLGSIVYKFAMSTIKSGTLLNKLASVSRVAASSISSVLPSTYADDENTSYMTNFGECEVMNMIGAVGTADCYRNETFDMSTVNISDEEYIAVKAENVTCGDDGKCEINKGSDFEKYIRYNAERFTPVGITDGGILKSLKNKDSDTSESSSGYSKIPFISSLKELLSMIWAKIKQLFGDDSLDIASGKAFVNTAGNDDWKIYKYAQRYMSEVRTVENLRAYDGDQTAYSNIPYIGKENPVIACIEEYFRELAMFTEE